jgi:hypothetical protein
MQEYDIHPCALIFPPMSKQDFDALAEDMRAHGLRDPITIYNSQIIDGRNRYRACSLLGISPRFEAFEGSEEEALAFVISKNLARRHLNEAQRAMVAESLATMTVGDNQHKKEGVQICTPSREEAAKKLNVSPRSVATARVVKQKAEPEVVKAVEDGNLSLNAAAKIAALPKKDQARVMVHPSPEKAIKKVARIKKEQDSLTKPAALLDSDGRSFEAALLAKLKDILSTDWGGWGLDEDWDDVSQEAASAILSMKDQEFADWLFGTLLNFHNQKAQEIYKARNAEQRRVKSKANAAAKRAEKKAAGTNNVSEQESSESEAQPTSHSMPSPDHA